ncbi:tail protein X [Campylobacter sputorum]|nr:tail protein X [Campylobacter sputorum]
MEIYKALDGDRFDKIVYKHYGHLKFFEQVLNINHQLTPVLKPGI